MKKELLDKQLLREIQPYLNSIKQMYEMGDVRFREHNGTILGLYITQYSTKYNTHKGDLKIFQDINVTVSLYASSHYPLTEETLQEAMEHFMSLADESKEKQRLEWEEEKRRIDELYSLNLGSMFTGFFATIKKILRSY